MYPAVLLMYFISAAVILLESLTLIVQVSLPYNKTGRASVLHSFILVYCVLYSFILVYCVLYSFILFFLIVFCGQNTLLKIPVIFKKLFKLLSMSNLK